MARGRWEWRWRGRRERVVVERVVVRVDVKGVSVVWGVVLVSEFLNWEGGRDVTFIESGSRARQDLEERCFRIWKAGWKISKYAGLADQRVEAAEMSFKHVSISDAFSVSAFAASRPRSCVSRSVRSLGVVVDFVRWMGSFGSW